MKSIHFFDTHLDFRDGNGRIGRLWQSVILMAHHPLFGILPTDISSIRANPKVSAAMLAEIVSISKRKVEENVTKLKKIELVERVCATRRNWEVRG